MHAAPQEHERRRLSDHGRERCPAEVVCADGRSVDTVIAGGRVLMEGRRVLTIDVEPLYAEAARVAPRLIARAGLRPAALR